MNDEKTALASLTSKSTADFSNREFTLVRHYTDPLSAGFLNKTKSAELAGYKGLPGSNQMSVQGSRTIKKAKRLGLLAFALHEKGCTPERVAERLLACVNATRKHVFLTRDNKIITSEPQDDFRLQLQAIKLVLELFGEFDCASDQGPSPAAACDVPEEGHAAEEHGNARAILCNSNAIDREALRDVLECDARSAEFEVQEPHNGNAEQSEEKPVHRDGDPRKT